MDDLPDIEGKTIERIQFPQVGRSLEPTPEAIHEGKHGNGAWDFTDGSVNLAYAEVHHSKKEAQDERRAHFNEEAKESLSEGVRLLRRLIDHANKVMDKVEAGDEDDRPTMVDLKILDKGTAAAKELADRATGKVGTAKDTGPVVESYGLAFMLEGPSDG